MRCWLLQSSAMVSVMWHYGGLGQTCANRAWCGTWDDFWWSFWWGWRLVAPAIGLMVLGQVISFASGLFSASWLSQVRSVNWFLRLFKITQMGCRLKLTFDNWHHRDQRNYIMYQLYFLLRAFGQDFIFLGELQMSGYYIIIIIVISRADEAYMTAFPYHKGMKPIWQYSHVVPGLCVCVCV